MDICIYTHSRGPMINGASDVDVDVGVYVDVVFDVYMAQFEDEFGDETALQHNTELPQ